MKSFYFYLFGWLFQLSGTLFLLFDSIRTGQRLPKEGVTLGDPASVNTWYHYYGSSIGFSLLFVGFFLCGIGMYLSRPKANKKITTPQKYKTNPNTTKNGSNE